MAKFLITYSGGAGPEGMSEEQVNEVMQAWMKWYGGLGDDVVDMGNPTGASKVVGSGGISDGGRDVTGYTIINAGSLDAAAAACQNHPHLDAGGEVQVYEALDMG